MQEHLTILLRGAWRITPTCGVIVATILALVLIQRLTDRRRLFAGLPAFFPNVLLLLIIAAGIIGMALTLPVAEDTRSNLLSLLGIVVSAAVALGSTTFVSNAMAGIMLHLVRPFRLGDFIRVDDHFGRVSERGVFHTEIQNDQSNLTTLPNLFLVTRPVMVVRASGTVIRATVSLGYDIPRATVESILMQAAEAAGLKDPFVQIKSLGDFSVTYCAAGLLEESKRLIAGQSILRAKMLDLLHENGIEIVSPTFMNQRHIAPGQRFVPDDTPLQPADDVVQGPQEDVVFRKAEYAALLGELQTRLTATIQQIDDLETKLAAATDDKDRTPLQQELDRARLYQRFLETRIKATDATVQEDNN